MFRRRVQSPDGRTWRLGRHWLPRRRKLGRARRPDVGDGGLLDFGGDDLGIVGVVIAVVVAFFIAVFLFLLVFNVVAIAIELLIFVVLLFAGVVGRVVFRRPWIVEARTKGPPEQRHEWPVVGYFNSRRRIAEVAGQLSMGTQLDPAPRDR